MTRTFNPGKPRDDVLLEILGQRHDAMTYVVRNYLRSSPYLFDVETPWVLRQMKRLERAGKVKRVSTSYAVQICWALVKEHVG
ncbi:hypothetical protein [Novosphingobium rosa]|uniref:hypothetical protein n=1 Tax=Novosphingobium rosa TaxID=76978 RepID=UPI0008307169|nr:hypothetical protein [Novosphingobium rosa]